MKRGVNKRGEEFEIISKQYCEKSKGDNYLVRFIDTNQYQWVFRAQINSGNFRDYSKPFMCGVGYAIGTEKEPLYIRRYMDIYEKWTSMLNRCYNNKFEPYKDVSVTVDWHCYNNFEKWYLSHYIEGTDVALDKDLFAPQKGGKYYSAETCCLLPAKLNSSLTKMFFNDLSKRNREKVVKFKGEIINRKNQFSSETFSKIVAKIDDYLKQPIQEEEQSFAAMIVENGNTKVFNSKKELIKYLTK